MSLSRSFPCVVDSLMSSLFSFCFFFFFFLNDTAPTEIYPLPLHDALPISPLDCRVSAAAAPAKTPTCHVRRSEEHTSELQSRGLISYAVFCLKKKTKN